MAVKTYPTKTQAIKAKKYGQTVRQRRDGTWVCEKPKDKYKKQQDIVIPCRNINLTRYGFLCYNKEKGEKR